MQIPADHHTQAPSSQIRIFVGRVEIYTFNTSTDSYVHESLKTITPKTVPLSIFCFQMSFNNSAVWFYHQHTENCGGPDMMQIQD